MEEVLKKLTEVRYEISRTEIDIEDKFFVVALLNLIIEILKFPTNFIQHKNLLEVALRYWSR